MPTYFSEARGLRKSTDLETLRTMVRDLYEDLEGKGHLAEWLGYDCVDAGHVPGTAGNPGHDIVLEVGRADIWPPDPVTGEWPEDAIFDFLQFIGDKVSSAIKGTGRFHDYDNCGWHDQKFEPEPARGEYVKRVNKLLSRYGDGWEMRPGFEIVERAPIGMGELLQIKLPQFTDMEIRRRVQTAVEKYRRRSSTRDDRRDAVRDLGDVLEPMRKEAEKHLGKDEADLFNILNNFDIRHNNAKQKRTYDPIWLAGLFYHYLAMIHVLTHLIERDRSKSPSKSN
jgi:hypothetical protein